MLTRRSFAAQAFAWIVAGTGGRAQQWTPNYDERQVPRHTLPPLMRFEGGRQIRTVEDWRTRRAELLDVFARHVYGVTPERRPAARVVIHESATSALEGRALRTQIAIEWPEHPGVLPLEVLVYQPAAAATRVPVFIGLNFFGNHAVHRDPALRMSSRWMRASEPHRTANHRASEASRGTTASRWPVEAIVDAGCAVMTAYCGDLAPDDPAEFGAGIAPLFAADVEAIPGEERWAALGMWAWGLARMRDLVDAIPGLDPSRAAVLGHSRLGKAALWAGAQDERFAMVISNNSGCGGAALSRRAYGETVGRITRAFPHWFCRRFAGYAEREGTLPIDQHQLLGLMAPRALYVASAVEDRWADPRGEFLAAAELDPLYRLLRVEGMGTRTMPPVDRPVGRKVRYHGRTGGHDITMYDWQQYLRTMKDTPGA